jgi:AraC family transcriptional regulator
VNSLVTPEQIPEWIPGEKTVDSTSRGWRGLEFFGYHYDKQDVEIPHMRDYMIVVYRGDAARMERSEGGPWQHATVKPGNISLLTRAESSRWAWTSAIDVQHIYLSHEALNQVAGDIYDRPLCDIEIHDRICAEDSVFPRIADAIYHELQSDSDGADLLAETLRTQSCVQLLRNYADIRFRELPSSGGFTEAQCQHLREFIRSHLSEKISLDEMAAVVQLSSFHFLRKFKTSFGQTPHQYVTSERICRAKSLLDSSNLPIAWIASEVGFSDQSHFSKTFHRVVGVTPLRYRLS